MKNVRVQSLSDVLKAADAPIIVSVPQGGNIKVRSVKLGQSLDDPDITLVAENSSVVGAFEDQRVALDLDHLRVKAKDTTGVERTITFG